MSRQRNPTVAKREAQASGFCRGNVGWGRRRERVEIYYIFPPLFPLSLPHLSGVGYPLRISLPTPSFDPRVGRVGLPERLPQRTTGPPPDTRHLGSTRAASSSGSLPHRLVLRGLPGSRPRRPAPRAPLLGRSP